MPYIGHGKKWCPSLKRQFHPSDLDLDPMILILKLDLDMSKAIADRQTDNTKTLPRTRAVIRYSILLIERFTEVASLVVNKYRIVSNCGPLFNCGPPYFLNEVVCHDMFRIHILSLPPTHVGR